MNLKNITKIILLFIVFLGVIATNTNNTAEAGSLRAKIDMRKFEYYNEIFSVNPIVVTGPTPDNYDPRFNIADLDSVTYSDDIPVLEKKAKAKVFPYINGSIFYKIEILEKINQYKLNGHEFAQKILNISKQQTWESETKRLNSYFIFPSTYKNFFVEKEKISNNSHILSNIKNPIYFFPGISHKLPLNDEVFPDDVMKTLQTSLGISENSTNKFYYTIDNFITLDKIAFGACYQINEGGIKNECFNTSKQNCTKYGEEKLNTEKRKHLYFLYGISCESIDKLLNNPSSRTNTKTATTQKSQYYMLLYFHGYFMEGHKAPYKSLTAEQTEARFAEKVFGAADMKTLQPNYITVWVNEPNKAFNSSQTNWGTIPFDEIISKSYDYCKIDSNKGSTTWDKTKKITANPNFTATINCGYNPGTANIAQTDIKVIAAGHSGGGTAMNQAIKNNKIYLSVLLDALYYAPVAEASVCTKWSTIQANMTATKNETSDGQPQIEAWKKLCPNNVNKGTTAVHDDIIKDLPAFLARRLATSTTSVEEQVPQAQSSPMPLKEKTLFKPQVSFAGIKDGIDMAEYINIIYKYLVTAGLFVTGVMIVLGGAKYLLGKTDGIGMIRNSMIGLMILASSHLIFKIISPNALELDAIQVQDIARKGDAMAGGGTPISTTSSEGDRSPSPPISINSGWYFPVIISDVNVSTFKYNATNKKSGGSFGYFRRTNSYALKNTPEYPVVCHHAVDIYTQGKGQVVAITDGVVKGSGNTFANCTGGQVGSIIIEHKDKDGKSFFARYGEIDVVDKNKFKPGAEVKANDPLGTATRCGMLHFELHSRAGGVTPKWRMSGDLWETILNELGFSESVKSKYKWDGKEITNIDKIQDDTETMYKNCLDSPTATNALINDKSSNHGQYLLNPSSLLIELWNKTGALNKQMTD